MKRTVFLFFLLITIFGCSPVNNCPDEKVEDYLLQFFDSIERIKFSNYLAIEQIKDPAEQSILMMSDRSVFTNTVVIPDCAIKHYEITLEVIDLLIEEILSNKSKTFNKDELENSITNLELLTDELISQIQNTSTKVVLQERKEEAMDIQKRAQLFFEKNVSIPINQISESEKEEILLGSIFKLLENEPGNILNQFSDYIDLKISENVFTFYISKENISNDIQKEIFKEIFIEAVLFSSNEENKLIWEIDKISVIFFESDNDFIEFYVEEYDFEKILSEPVILGDIVKMKTTSSVGFINEPSNEEKEQIIMGFIIKTIGDEPENLLNKYIGFVDLSVENNRIIFYVKDGNFSTQKRIELFKELFIDAIIMATNSDNNLIWDINRISVIFKEKSDTKATEYYVNDEKFDEFFNNPSSLLNIYKTQPYDD